MNKMVVGKGKTIEDAINAGLKELGVTPVSYTHLDVYKRQVWEVSSLTISACTKKPDSSKPTISIRVPVLWE